MNNAHSTRSGWSTRAVIKAHVIAFVVGAIVMLGYLAAPKPGNYAPLPQGDIEHEITDTVAVCNEKRDVCKVVHESVIEPRN